MFPLGYVHVSMFFKVLTLQNKISTLNPIRRVACQKVPFSPWTATPWRWNVKSCSEHRTRGDTDGFATGGPWIWWVGKVFGFGWVERPWNIAGNWKELAKECLAMRVEPVETWLSWHFLLRNGGGQQFLFGQIELRCFFFPLVLMHKKGVNTRVI